MVGVLYLYITCLLNDAVKEFVHTPLGRKYFKKAIEEWAKKNGYQKMYLNSYFKNKTALAFYQASGHKAIDIFFLEKNI